MKTILKTNVKTFVTLTFYLKKYIFLTTLKDSNHLAMQAPPMSKYKFIKNITSLSIFSKRTVVKMCLDNYHIWKKDPSKQSIQVADTRYCYDIL